VGTLYSYAIRVSYDPVRGAWEQLKTAVEMCGKVKTRTLENHKGCGTPSAFYAPPARSSVLVRVAEISQ